MAQVELSRIRKSFGGAEILHELDLSIESGEFMVLVGPSGCGKSTLLRLVAGLEEPSGGAVSIEGKVVNDLSPKERGVAMVFQNYALYPHMSVRQNLAFALQLSRLPSREIESRVLDAAKVLSIEEHLDKRPSQLSGGQKQRVAMGRAMVRRPKVFLFDEPLSNLDAQLRVKMRSEIAQLHRRLKSTVIYVTHDQVEAMTLADRIAVMRAGRLEQVGPPLEVYRDPRTRFVASFIGTPSMNFLPAASLPAGLAPREAATVGFRPEATRLAPGPGDGLLSLGSGTVVLVEPLGVSAHVHLRVGDEALVAELRTADAPPLDAAVELRVDPRELFFFDGQGRRVLAPDAAPAGRAA